MVQLVTMLMLQFVYFHVALSVVFLFRSICAIAKKYNSLIDLIVKICYICVREIPAFSHMHKTEVKNGKTLQVGYIKPHPLVRNWYKTVSGHGSEMSFSSLMLPSIVPPRPWSRWRDGGYLLTPVAISRVERHKDAFQHHAALDRHNSQLLPVLDALNYVSSCAWTINKAMFDVVMQIFKSGGDDSLGIPSSTLPEIPEIPKDEMDQSRLMFLRRQQRLAKKDRNEKNSLRMDMIYRLSLAHYFQDEIFWLPSNMDFRGRAYTVAPHLSHLGSDVARCLLVFAHGKRLGDKGLDWLKLQIANCQGTVKKVTIAERVNYTTEMMKEVFNSADHPLDGRGWWQKADDPLQCLAACKEIVNAIRSGDPKNFISHLPIHQDGACNGLQHFATLGRDQIGAEQVNVAPADVPRDVYASTANLVEQLRAKDAAEGVVIAQKLEGKVNRKVIKQTVMTITYGVTLVGGREQIAKQLKEQDAVHAEDLWAASCYLVKAVFSSLTEMFGRARQIQVSTHNYLTHPCTVSYDGC
jgi:DNA-directed RNA polymerase